MTLAQDIDNGEEVVVFASLSPKLKAHTWTLEPTLGVATNVYSHELIASSVENVLYNDTTFTPHSSIAGFVTPTADKYFFDIDANKIYFDMAGKPTPGFGSEYVQISYTFSVSTHEVVNYQDPTDSGTDAIQWSPYLAGFPSISKSVDQGVYGFMPSITSSINLFNHETVTNQILRHSTLSNAGIEIYISLRDLDTATCKKIFSGNVTSISWSIERTTLSLTDGSFLFEGVPNTYSGGPQKYDSLNYPNCDPVYKDTYIPTIFGAVDSHECVNLRFDTSNAPGRNRRFNVCNFGPTFNIANHRHSYVVQGSPAPTATRIYLNTVQYLNPGDVIFSTTTTDKEFRIETVGSNYVDGENYLSTIVGGETLRRDVVGYVQYIDTDASNVVGRYTMSGASPVASVAFNVRSLELTLNFSPPDSHKVFVRVYGRNNTNFPVTPTLSAKTGTTSKWHQILYNYMTSLADIDSSQINTTRFTDFEANPDDHEDIGIVIPAPGSRTKPTHKEVITKILNSRLASLYQNSDGLYDIFDQSVLGASSNTLSELEIISGSLDYEENYSETCSLAEVNFRPQMFFLAESEIDDPLVAKNADPVPGFFIAEGVLQYTPTFYAASQTKTVETLIFRRDAAEAIAAKAIAIFGYSNNVYSLKVGFTYFEIDIGDVVQIEASSLPGYTTLSSANFITGRVIAVSYDSSGVSLKVWDQRGIEENSGDF